MTSTSISTSAAAITIALAVALPGCGATTTVDAAPAAQAITTTSQATRLREFRHMIVGLYRVAPARSDEDPIDALRRALTTQYGPVPSRGISA